jgi:hypothetical protein
MSTLTLTTPTDQAKQGRTIAQIALAQPERPTSGDVLISLNRAFQAGYDQAVEDLARGILRGAPRAKRQAL